jgi:hypothetical protein
MRIWFNHQSIDHLRLLFQTTLDSEVSIFCPFCDAKVVPSIDQGPGQSAHGYLKPENGACLAKAESQVLVLMDIWTQKPGHAWLKCE